MSIPVYNDKRNQQSPNYVAALKKLTPREIEILEMTGGGYTSQEIADKLYISSRTVEKHRQNIKKKLVLEGYKSIEKWYHFYSTT